MGRPREHDEPTRARILEEAARLLSAEGAQGLTVRRVADESETTTRAIYSLFGDKQGLLRALFHEAAAVLTSRHEQVQRRLDPVREMVELALAYRQAALEHPNLYGLLMNDVPGFSPDPDDIRLARRSFARVASTLQRLADDGRLGGRTAERAGSEMWALVHGMASLELRRMLGSAGDAEAVWRDAVETTVRGLERPPRKRR
jgi:AcrR family transcriptional regulator